MLDPRVRSIAACEEGNPDVPIGFIHFKRLGDDEVANAYIKQKASALLFILRWLFWAYYLLIEAVVGNKSEDAEAIRQFRGWAEEDEGRYWAPYEERKRRIHVLSFVVLKQFQGRGVGKKLISEVTRRAVDENVVVGLEASPEGEFIVSRLCSDLISICSSLSIHASSCWRQVTQSWGLDYLNHFFFPHLIELPLTYTFNSIEGLDLRC